MRGIRDIVVRYARIVKYLISGGSAAAVNLGILLILTEFGHLHYLVSAVLAFIVAFFASFLLQKFWTFKDRGRANMHTQMLAYLIVSVANLGLNTLLIYLFVEFFHLWYLFAAIIAGGLIAIESFLIYRHLIFAQGENEARIAALLSRIERQAPTILVIAAFLLSAFLATYKLTESPPTWLDEGIITQVALQAMRGDLHAQIQTAPGHTESAGFVSTAYPVTFPVALSMALFGRGLLQARAVMALYILLLVGAAYVFLRREASAWGVAAALALLATFAPLYGNGKNVLGEVPGLFFLLLFLFFITRIESRRAAPLELLGAGITLGLAVVTKPIFLLLIPVVIAVFLFSPPRRAHRTMLWGGLGFIAPVWLWLTTQFSGESLWTMLRIYANPHDNNILAAIAHNAYSFISQPQPLYALLLLCLWAGAIVVRIKRNEQISHAEKIAIGFAVLVYLAYLRGADYYRYFFVGEVLALLYLPKALGILRPSKVPVSLVAGIVIALVSAQFYQSLYSSWVASAYTSRRTEALSSLASIAAAQSVFIYQAPEAVIFLPPTARYAQYIRVTPSIDVGRDQLSRVARGQSDIVVTPAENLSDLDLTRYGHPRMLDRYLVWYKNNIPFARNPQ